MVAVVAFALLLSFGCAQKPTIASLGDQLARSEIYAGYHSEAKECYDMSARYDADKSSVLSASEMRRMAELQKLPNRVALKATGVLGSYGLRQPEASEFLRTQIPILMEGPGPWQIASAASAAKWYKLDEYRDDLAKVAELLQAKPSLTDDELSLKLSIEYYMKKVPAQ